MNQIIQKLISNKLAVLYDVCYNPLVIDEIIIYWT